MPAFGWSSDDVRRLHAGEGYDPAAHAFTQNGRRHMAERTGEAQPATVAVAVDVTADDIAKGVEGSCWLCPVARALRRAVGVRASTAGGACWYKADRTYLPNRVARWVARFDTGNPVRPFRFTVRVPRWWVKRRAMPA